MEGQTRIERRGECLWAAGRGADARDFAAMCRALAVTCIESEIKRVLIDATGCEPEGAHAVRDAFTVMALAGIPDGLRVAIVASGPLHLFLAGVTRDLTRLRINAKLFGVADAAADWLDCPRRVGSPAGEPATA